MSTTATPIYPYNGKVLLAAVILLSIVIFVVILLHVYARWFLGRQPIVVIADRNDRRMPAPAFPSHFEIDVGFASEGLDAKVVASIPMFVYKPSEHEDGVDCMVCLSVMEEGEHGRVLPRCKHAFHVGCIDMWLTCHSTCPMCRSAVAADAEEAPVVVVAVGDEGAVRDEIEISDGPSEVLQGSTDSSSSSSLSSSLKRMVSRSRSESRVFPSVLIV